MKGVFFYIDLKIRKTKLVNLIQLKMSGEKDLEVLLKSMQPEHNLGDYVFCEVEELGNLNLDDVQMFFKEKEAITLILKKETADPIEFRIFADHVVDNTYGSFIFGSCWIDGGIFKSTFR